MLLLFTAGLGRTALWDNDEALYTEIARQIVRRADPMTLYWNGSPWFVHPPLAFWLSAATGALLGFSEFTARLWSVLFGTAGVLVTYLLGRRLYDHRTGIISGLILATSLEYVILARGAGLDMPLLAFMLAAFYMVIVAEGNAESAARRRAYRWAFLWAGLATLSKGPIGLLLPGMVIGAWWLLRGVGRQRLRALPWDGFAIYAAVGLSWYAVEAIRWGMPFLRQVVGYYMFTRFFGVVENQPGPWYYYVPVLLIAAFPWTAYLPGAVIHHSRQIRQDGRSALLLLWMGITFVFYSLARTKLPNYILPVLPAAAIAISRVFALALGEGGGPVRRLVRASTAVLIVVVVLVPAAIGVYLQRAYPAEFAAVGTLLLPPALLAAAAALLHGALIGRRPAAALGSLIVLTAAAYGALVLYTAPRLEPLRPMRPLAEILRAEARPGDRIVAVGQVQRSALVYYSEHRVGRVGPRPGDLRREMCGRPRAYVVVSRADYERWLQAAFPGDFTPVAEKGSMMLLRLAKWIPCGPL